MTLHTITLKANSKAFSYLLASENPVTCVSIGNFTINDRHPFHSQDLNTIFPYSLKNISSNWSFENLVPNHPFAWHYIDNAWRKKILIGHSWEWKVIFGKWLHIKWSYKLRFNRLYGSYSKKKKAYEVKWHIGFK